jgi:O-antigen ligase
MEGHLNEENGVLVDANYFAPHAHNLYLQHTYDFGIPVGILFAGYLLLNTIYLFKEICN